MFNKRCWKGNKWGTRIDKREAGDMECSTRAAPSTGAESGAEMKRFKAAVIGGSGYGGAEIIRRLLLHPDVELCRVASIDYVGEPLGAAHFHLEGLSELTFENLAPA